jgi:hypothetical protein
MQWPAFFEGRLLTNGPKGEYVPISRTYGFIWLFIAGVPWAGLGACALAWCGSLHATRVWHWILRIAFGVCCAWLARYIFDNNHAFFLPLYDTLGPRYEAAIVEGRRLSKDPNLARLVGDCGSALNHLGYYLGFLLFEFLRRDWKNVVLILTVGMVNGAGWALCQNWKWAVEIWGTDAFNFWRCWESSAGLSIGLALGVAYFLVNRPMSDRERAIVATRQAVSGPSFEWLLIYGGLAWFLSLYLVGELAGERNITPWFTSHLSPELRPTVRQYLSWRGIYFSVVLAFGAAYYLLYRRRAIGSIGERLNSLVTAVMALAFIGALIVALFVPQRDLAGRVLTSLGFTGLTGRWLNLIYLGAVMLFGLLCYLARYRSFTAERAQSTPAEGDPNIERWGLGLGLLCGLGVSLHNGMKGWFNTYKDVHGHLARRFWQYLGVNEPNEGLASVVLWHYLGPAFLICLVAVALCILIRRLPRDYRGDSFPRAYGIIWLVLIFQNVIAQFITGPLSEWKEMAFNIYYVLLFAITATIVIHYDQMRVYQECFAMFPVVADRLPTVEPGEPA